uniref:Uncharacterized protein n=1 Tax=Suricata suricatta TaxID=37032 RepID=A0A673SKQ0_SURSU
MVGQRVLLLAGFFLSEFLLSEAAKILIGSSLGGSHHLLLDRVSEILQDHGYNVTMLRYGAEFLIPENNEKPYQVISCLPPEDYEKEINQTFNYFMTEALHGSLILQRLVVQTC